MGDGVVVERLRRIRFLHNQALGVLPRACVLGDGVVVERLRYLQQIIRNSLKSLKNGYAIAMYLFLSWEVDMVA